MKPRALVLPLAVASTFFLPAKAAADGIVRGFNYKSPLQPGMAVSLVSGSKDTVQALPGGHPELIYGVVIDPSDTPLTVQKSANQVYVASSGSFPVLVSTQHGNIKNGDYISASSINGIAAKATSTDTLVIGRAQQDFKGGSATIFTAADNSSVGEILAQISPGNNPNIRTEVAVPGSLRRVSSSIAGKNVSALRIYGSVAVLVIGIITAAILLFGGVRSGMSAIGRNPLSRKSIVRGIIQVLVITVLVFVASLMGIYLLLKL